MARHIGPTLRPISREFVILSAALVLAGSAWAQNKPPARGLGGLPKHYCREAAWRSTETCSVTGRVVTHIPVTHRDHACDAVRGTTDT
jgi:hypothetical protein